MGLRSADAVLGPVVDRIAAGRAVSLNLLIRRFSYDSDPPIQVPTMLTLLLKRIMAAMHRPVYESRLRALTSRIAPHLRANDLVLDVGCGSGTLGSALLSAPDSPDNLTVEGLERVRRGGEPIFVHAYDGGDFPFEDDSFDVVIIADVLHHEDKPDELLVQCARVARRLVIVKDHQVVGLLAQKRISFIDWAANAPYGVPCLYRYNTPEQWSDIRQRLALTNVEVVPRMRVYPPIFEFFFGGALQHFAVLAPEGSTLAQPSASERPIPPKI